MAELLMDTPLNPEQREIHKHHSRIRPASTGHPERHSGFRKNRLRPTGNGSCGVLSSDLLRDVRRAFHLIAQKQNLRLELEIRRRPASGD